MRPDWQQALDLTQGVEPTPKSIERAAEALGPELARWAFGQWALREKARSKFTKASEMLFDRPGLEMATHEGLAAYHASRFPAEALVADLTAGIGADLIALASRGPVVGFELDEVRAEYARHNLGLAAPLPASPPGRGEEREIRHSWPEIRVADSLAAEWDFEYAFADPARRTESARTWNPDEFSPHPIRLAERFKSLKLAGMKLSPMLRDDFFRHLPGRIEFVSFGGECRESLVWMGTEAEEGRYAVQVRRCAGTPVGQIPKVQSESLASGKFGETTEVAEAFLFEADPAAIRADALGTLSRLTGTKLLADSNGYLTGAKPIESPWLTGYRVLADHPADLRRTNTVLRMLDAGTPVVKSRVARFDVETLRRQLRGEGRELIVAVYAEGKKLRHSVLERLS
jgi:hypothetical protein